MFKIHFFALASIMAITGISTFAGGSDHPVTAVSWEEFKGRCQDKSKYPDQRSPQAIRVQCMDTMHEFVQDLSGAVAMPSVRQVATAFFSDKFRVDPLVKDFAVTNDAGTCVRYKEVIRTFTFEMQFNCAEVLGVKGDIQDYCAEYLDSMKGGKWGKGKGGYVSEAPTGRVIDTCAASGITGKSFE
jgi:hypothetical protein